MTMVLMCDFVDVQDQNAKEKALQSISSMSSAQIVSATAIHSKLLPGIVRSSFPGNAQVTHTCTYLRDLNYNKANFIQPVDHLCLICVLVHTKAQTHIHTLYYILTSVQCINMCVYFQLWQGMIPGGQSSSNTEE